MDNFSPQDLLKVQRRATRRGFLIGVIAGSLGVAMTDMYIQLYHAKQNKKP